MSTDIASPQPPAPPEDFDPMDPGFIDDPGPMLKRMREECPVFYSEKYGFWGISTYDDVSHVLTDFATFSQGALRFPPIPEQYRERIEPSFFSTALIVSDPPTHTGYRKAGNTQFTRGRIRAFEPKIRAIAHELIDGFVADEQCDLMDQYCYALTISSMMLLMGLPTEEMPRLRQFSYDFAQIVQDGILPMTDRERVERWGHHVGVREWFKENIVARRGCPADDMISQLGAIEGADGCPLFDDDRLATHVTEFLFGGTDSSAITMGQAVRMLDEHPDQRDEVITDPGLTENMIEEVLRMNGPAVGLWKATTRDVEMGGYTIPKGATVYVMQFSAGLDGEKFPDPERFDIHRENLSDHVTFGLGRHFCIGAPLARAELKIGLQTLYERIPDIRLAPDAGPLPYQRTALARVLESLPVVWGSKAL